jgi:outer membrane protein assembly factor BamD (BamD/ComL family)
MRRNRLLPICLCMVLVCAVFQPVRAQLGFDLDVKKPAPYEDRLLKAEKTPEGKKLKQPKKFFQNLTTRYNYYFNANVKLNEVIENAKQSHVDDYSQLLPFYNYSLDVTAQDQVQLDSVIYKSQTAIVMHDLRNDWMDNMYMLWGAAYFFQKKFDSATLMFQFINYSFAEKEKDGYYKYIGSRMDGNNALSVSTKEEGDFFKKTFNTTPSRNDAFIWQIRSLIEGGHMTYAGSLIATLKQDPVFPERLKEELEEVQALWFYNQKIWDSAATHLLLALDQAKTKQEKARWEYLAAQMFEKTGKPQKALELFTASRAHATDPVMDVYARLNMVRLNQSSDGNMDPDLIGKNVADLVKMGERSKYEDYRDVIFYMAAQMELERKNFAAAQELLLRASKYNNGNLTGRGNVFLQIADIAYDQKKFEQASAFYDSVDVTGLKEDEIRRIDDRKMGLSKAVAQIKIITRHDSLQKIALMPEEERNALIKKIVKNLRKQQGLAEENSSLTAGSSVITPPPPSTIFDNQDSKGEWYFYNGSLKTQGMNQFKQAWGNRPNVDNWRRFAAVSSQVNTKAPGKTDDNKPQVVETVSVMEENGPTFNSVLSRVPLTPEKLRVSNDSVMLAMFDLASVYINDLEEYPSAIEVLEKLRLRFPAFPSMDEALFNLYYAYTKTGDHVKAAQVKSLIGKQYADSRFNAILTTGKDPESASHINPASTKDYEKVYDLFIEGKFEEAKTLKKIADSTYKTNHWQPQLLYIEAVYHIRQREDSVASHLLQVLIAQNNGTDLARKAQNLLSVLQRRKEIEAELTNLQVTRPPEDSMITITQPVVQKPQPVTIDTTAVVKKPKENVPEKDTVISNAVRSGGIPVGTKEQLSIIPNQPRSADTSTKVRSTPKETLYGYSFDVSEPHYVMLVLDKVDAVFSGESLNAFNRYNREKYSAKNYSTSPRVISAEKKLVLIGPLSNTQESLDYMAQAKRLAPTEIIPWLKAEKYSFLVISETNLPVLEEKKDLTLYRQFLEQYLPGKF